jgi:serine/threonine-protein kinase
MTDDLDRLHSALADRYAIGGELGVGGMATVYEAEDLKHHRKVALKVLKPELAAVVGTDRFLREIVVAARLNHPHILPLLDSGEAEGTLYYTMPLIAGPSLADRIRSEGPLGIDEIRALVADVASALDYAHAQGIVHRDIKPANVLLHHDKPMVADFGIALAVSQVGGERLTETGISIGTPQYMSPEQVTGDRILDARSDVYALGCVVYEMLVGDPPFTGRTALAVMARHVTDPVPPIRTVRRDVPASVEEAVTKALAKVPGDRFSSVGEFATALAASDVAGPAPRADFPVATAAERPLAEGARRGVANQEEPLSTLLAGERARVAVLPFENLSPEPENAYFADGITEDIITHLCRIPGLKVIARTSVMQFKDRRDVTLRRVAEDLGVGAVVEGSVRRAGDRLRIVATLIDAPSENHLWTDTYDRRLTDIFEIQTDIATNIAAALRTTLSRADRARLEKAPTANMDAYGLWLRGRSAWAEMSVEGLERSLELFRRATELDPGFPHPYVGIADACIWRGIGLGVRSAEENYDAAKVAALHALELDATLAEAHSSLAHVQCWFEWDWDAAERSFERALALNPSYALAREGYATHLTCTGRHAQAMAQIDIAEELDPLSLEVKRTRGWLLWHARDHHGALETLRQVLSLEPTFAPALLTIPWVATDAGRIDEAIDLARKAIDATNRSSHIAMAALAYAYTRGGRAEEARRILDDIWALPESDRHNANGHVIPVYAALGDRERALQHLDRAYRGREAMMMYAKVGTHFDGIRAEPRFRELIREMELGEETPQPVAPSREAPASSDKPMIVVLPLTNMSSSAEDEYFSDGMTEDIIAQLSQIGSLQVISRTSAMRYKNSTQSVKEIAAALGATHVVEGSVRRAGDRLRIVAQLIDASSDAHLWAHTFDRDMTDVFEVQSEVAERIAGSLKRKLTPAERRRFERRPTGDMEAYREYLLGRHHWARWTEDDFKQSIRRFEAAIERDPDFAEAHAALSEAWSHLGIGYWSVRPLDAYPKARDAALQAVELDPESAEAHARLAMVEWWFEFAFDRALERLERATALNPNCASAFDYRANLLTMLGRHEEALKLGQRSCELDPASVFINANYGLYLYRARRWSEAIAQLQRVIDLDPNLPMGHALQAMAHVESGDGQRALEGFRRADELSSGHHAYRVMLGYGHAAADNRDLARQILREIEAVRPEQNVWLVMLAAGYAKLGETERALDLLEDAYRERGGWIVWLAVEPSLDGLRAEPRFSALLIRMGLQLLERETPNAGRPSLLVLPFENLSPDPENDYLGDGLTDELITDLANVRSLRVIARSSSMKLKGTSKDLATLGRELGVQYALEGSVRRAGEDLRITAQLVNVAEQAPFWAERYSGTAERIFDLQEQVSRAIVKALDLELTREEQQVLAVRPIPSLLAYECYLKARREILNFDRVSIEQALAKLQEGLEILGDNVLLLRGLGLAQMQLLNVGASEDESLIDDVEATASKIRALDPDSAAGFLLAGCAGWLRGDFRRAVLELSEAYSRDPADPDTMLWLSVCMLSTGQPERSRAIIDELVRVDPLAPLSHLLVAYVAFFQGRFGDSVKPMRRSLELGPHVPVSLWCGLSECWRMSTPVLHLLSPPPSLRQSWKTARTQWARPARLCERGRREMPSGASTSWTRTGWPTGSRTHSTGWRSASEAVS